MQYLNPKINIVTVLVTPDLAREWLTRNQNNRPLKHKHVERLCNSILSGKWKMTGDPIRFSNTGKLIDGQHRLNAIEKSGVSVMCVVMKDLDEDIFDVIDSGRTRQKSDIISIEFPYLSFEVAKILGTSATIAYEYQNELFSFQVRVEKSELLEFIKSNQKIIDCAEYAQSLSRPTPCSRAIAGAFLFFTKDENHDKALRFIRGFMSGENLPSGNVLLTLRDSCFNARINRRPIQIKEIFGRLIKCWNAEVRGKPLTAINSTYFKDEKFPRFIG